MTQTSITGRTGSVLTIYPSWPAIAGLRGHAISWICFGTARLYEVFINERLALAAGGYKTSDAFEAKVSFVQGRRGKVLGRLVAQAGARGVSNLSAVLQRTSTFVKVQLFMKHVPAVLLPIDGFPAVVCTSGRGNRLLRPAG